MLQRTFPEGKYLSQLTEQDSDLIPFALAHALYQLAEIPACILACRLKLAEVLNDYALAQRIEQKFGYSIKDLRKDILIHPIHLVETNPNIIDRNQPILKTCPLGKLSYFFFRKIWFIISGHEYREKRRQHKRQTKEGIV